MAFRFSSRTLRSSLRGRTTRSFSRVAARPVVRASVVGGAALGAGILFAGAVTIPTVALASDGELSPKQIDAIKAEIVDVLENLDYDDGSYGPVLVRLAWHSAGTYNKDTKTGGSNAASMRFSPEADWGANAGLAIARNLLEPIKKRHPEISYSDLWILAGVTAIEAMGGPKIGFRTGRKDVPDGKSNPLPDGLLPDASQGAKHLRDIFYRMGFNDQEIVALSGAHSLGRCHPDRSGFDGPWTRAPTTFSNEYFRLLLEEKWVKETLKNGNVQFRDAASKQLMMLPADLALIEDPAFKKWVQVYSKDGDLFAKDFASAFQKLTELGCSWTSGDVKKEQGKSFWKKIFG